MSQVEEKSFKHFKRATSYKNYSVVSFTVEKVVHSSNLQLMVGECMGNIMADIETAVAHALRDEWGIANNALNLTFSVRQVANEDIPKIEVASLIANPELVEVEKSAVCRWTWHQGGGGYWETACISDKYFNGENGEVSSCHSCGRPVEWETAVSQGE